MNPKTRAWKGILKNVHLKSNMEKNDVEHVHLQAVETHRANDGISGDHQRPWPLARSRFTRDTLRSWGSDNGSSPSSLNLLVVQLD